MNEPRPISAEDLALYALRALPADEMAAVAAALQANPAAREELARVQGDLALLALSSEQHAAPAGSLDRLKLAMRQERSSDGESAALVDAGSPQNVQEIRSGTVRRRKSTVIVPWTIAAGLAIACSILGYRNSALNDALNDQVKLSANLAARASRAQQVLEVLNAPEAQRVTLSATHATPEPTAHTVYLADRGALVLEASHLKPVPAGKAYELWILPASGAAPVAAGVFKPDAQGFASLVLPQVPLGIAAKGFGVTVESDKGSPTPTSPIVLSGE